MWRVNEFIIFLQWMMKNWYGPQVMPYMQWRNSPSQLSPLGALPSLAASHFHAALTYNWKGMCLWTPLANLGSPRKVCPPAGCPRCQAVCHTLFNPPKQPEWMQCLWCFTVDFCLKLTVGFALLLQRHPNDFLSFCLELTVWLHHHSSTDKMKLFYSVVKWWSAESIKTYPNGIFIGLSGLLATSHSQKHEPAHCLQPSA